MKIQFHLNITLFLIVLLLTIFTIPVFASSGVNQSQGASVIDIPGMLAELAGLSVFVFAAVAFLKQAGVAGQWLTFSSFAIGLVFGMAFRYATQPMTDFTSWFVAAIFGLLAGFIASGAYKGGQSMTGNDQPKTPPQ